MVMKSKPTGTAMIKAKPKPGTSLATTPGTSMIKAKPKAKPTIGPKERAAKSRIATAGRNRGKTIAKVAAATPIIAGGSLLLNKDKTTKAAKVTFGEAFKEARKKGEGTKFTYNGKSYTAVTKDDLKKKGYDANELKQYANRKGKARGPVRRAAQGIKKVLLGKDKKFGGDKGAIDFIRRSKPKKKMDGGMANSSEPKKYQSGGMATKKYKAGGLATKGLGKAYINSKR